MADISQAPLSKDGDRPVTDLGVTMHAGGLKPGKRVQFLNCFPLSIHDREQFRESRFDASGERPGVGVIQTKQTVAEIQAICPAGSTMAATGHLAYAEVLSSTGQVCRPFVGRVGRLDCGEEDIAERPADESLPEFYPIEAVIGDQEFEFEASRDRVMKARQLTEELHGETIADVMDKRVAQLVSVVGAGWQDGKFWTGAADRPDVSPKMRLLFDEMSKPLTVKIDRKGVRAVGQEIYNMGGPDLMSFVVGVIRATVGLGEKGRLLEAWDGIGGLSWQAGGRAR
jgi:hypothetical protein